MKTKFELGQIVYTINENKIVKCVIIGIKLLTKIATNTNFKDFKDVDYTLCELASNTKINKKKNKDGIILKSGYSIFRSEDTIFSSIEEMMAKIKNNYDM